MKIFIDSAELEEIKLAYSWGVAEGITTNPSLLRKAVENRKKKGEKLDIKSYISKILLQAKGTPVSLEVTETSAAGMVEQGKKLYKLFNPVAHNVLIKIPVNPALKEQDTNHFDGLAAIRKLAKEKIPVNCTLVFTPEQALLAAKAGATLVSPFTGRVDDYLRSRAHLRFEKQDYFPAGGMERGGRILDDNGIVSGIELVQQCVRILRQHELKAKVLAASLRNPRQVREAALAGADLATLPFGVIRELLQHYKTYEGMKRFTEDTVKEYHELTMPPKKEKHSFNLSEKLGISVEVK